MSTFKFGDVVYSIHGEQLEYVAKVECGHVVRPVYECEDGPSAAGKPRIDQHVFDKEPSQRYAEQTAAAKAELDDAQRRLTSVRELIRNTERERSELLSKLAKEPDLSIVAAWLGGKVSHLAKIARYSGAITILPIAEALLPGNENDRRNGEVRLLALYGGYTGYREGQDGFRWKLNAYRDGSGDNTDCILGTSVDDVKQRLQVWLDAELKRKNSHYVNDHVAYADSALKLGLTVPTEFVAKVAERNRKAVESHLQQAESELARARTSVEAMVKKVESLKAEQAALVSA